MQVYLHSILFVSVCLALSWCGHSSMLIAYVLVLAIVSEDMQHICPSTLEYFVMKNTASFYSKVFGIGLQCGCQKLHYAT